MADQPRLAVESIAGQRPYQEDSVLAEQLSDGRTLLAVADGMGGHAAGEVASSLALETLVEAVEGDGPADLSAAFHLANERVHRMASEPGKQGMGTTLVALLADGQEFWVANVGDSRVYRVSQEGIRRLTEDHSFVAEAVRRGQSEEEAMATPWKDALTRSIGTEPDVEVDVCGPLPIKGDEAFVMCSDGLYKSLSDEEIRELFVKSGGARGAAQSLVTAAFDAGSDDNISVAIAEFGEVPRDVAPTTTLLAYDPDPSGSGEIEDEATGPAATGDSDKSPPIAVIFAVAVVLVVLLVVATFGG